MLTIRCPWCGERSEIEFTYGGDADSIRPADWQGVGDEAWAGYLYMEVNPRGPYRERWLHSAGCGEWFSVVRNTLTNEIVETSPTATARRSSDEGA